MPGFPRMGARPSIAQGLFFSEPACAHLVEEIHAVNASLDEGEVIGAQVAPDGRTARRIRLTDIGYDPPGILLLGGRDEFTDEPTLLVLHLGRHPHLDLCRLPARAGVPTLTLPRPRADGL